MSKPLVMILGASRYYVRCIAAAKELGCRVLVTDRNAQSEGFRFADHHEVVDITDIPASIALARRYGVAGVVAVNDFGVPTAAAVAGALGLPGIGKQAAEHATSKAWMRRIWAKNNVPSVNFRIVDTLAGAYAAAEELDRWPLIVKPADSRGGGSRGVSRVNCKRDLHDAVTFAQSFYADKSIVLEEFLDGTEHSLETITDQGQTFVVAASDKVKTPPPYRVDKSVIYPSAYDGTALTLMHEAARSAVRALGISIGAAHVELCMTSQGPKLFEVGARCGGGGTSDPIVPWVTGIELMKEVIRLALGERAHCLIPTVSRGCVYRFLTPAPGRIQSVSGIDNVKAWPNILDAEMLVKQGDEISPVRTGADRAGFLIAAAETRQQAIDLADRAEREITIHYQQQAA